MGKAVKIIARKPRSKRRNLRSRKQKANFSESLDSPVDQVLHLQRTLGNQAVQRMMKSGALQAKLRIGQPNDKYEQEADRVAAQVIRMPESQVQPQPEEKEKEELQTKPLAAQITPLVQRQTEPEKEEEEEEEKLAQPKLEPNAEYPIQRQTEEEEEEEKPPQASAQLQRQAEEPKEEEEEKGSIQTKQAGGRTPQASHGLQAQIHSLKSGGQPLPKSERAFFEPRFGHDFSQVRVHNDSQAAESARAVNAKAFTTGKDIAFSAGQYAPETSRGRQLLAHELTHVLQQEQTETSIHLHPDEKPSKESPTDELTRSILAHERPLKLSLYDSEADESKFFKHQANMIAEAIEAVRMPKICPKDKTKLKLNVGAVGFTDSDILPHLKNAKTCTGRKITEFHVVGHTHDGVRFGKAARYAEYVEPGVKVVFHGCSVLSYKEGLTKLLKAFGSEAEIFAHPISGEAGRPYEFRRVTIPEGNKKIKTELLKQVTVILPKSYIMKWASQHKSNKLYALLRRKESDVQDDSKETIAEVLKARLEKDVKKWSEHKLEKIERKSRLYEWEREVILEEIANRATLKDSVQYWKTSMLEQTLKEPLISIAERAIIAKELGKRRRLKKAVKRWSERKLELNLKNPIHWVREIITEELHRRRRKK